jgi:LysR family glycine cleavage system transcriptional activator
LRAFEATARHLSMKLAADELSVTPTAVSHQIRQLEDLLGVALFERRVRALRLTPQGLALFPTLRDGFDAFETAIRRVKGESLRETVTVTVTSTTALTACWLVPAARAFQLAHPELDLRLHASDQPVSLLGAEADVAIRYGEGAWPGMVAEHLFDDGYAPVCSPALKLCDPAELSTHLLLHSSWQPGIQSPPTWPVWAGQVGLPELDTDSGITFSDEMHAVGAAVQGQGVALVNLPLIATELAAGTLVAPFGPVLKRFAFYLVYPVSRRDERKTRAVRDWVRSIAVPERLGPGVMA